MLALIGLVYFGYAELTLICQHKRSLNNNNNNDNNMNLEWKHVLVCYRRMDWDESFLLCACSANQRALDPVIAEFWVIVVPMAALKLHIDYFLTRPICKWCQLVQAFSAFTGPLLFKSSSSKLYYQFVAGSNQVTFYLVIFHFTGILFSFDGNLKTRIEFSIFSFMSSQLSHPRPLLFVYTPEIIRKLVVSMYIQGK